MRSKFSTRRRETHASGVRVGRYMNGNIAPLDATSTTDELRIPIAVALGLVAKLHVQNLLGRDGQGNNQPM